MHADGVFVGVATYAFCSPFVPLGIFRALFSARNSSFEGLASFRLPFGQFLVQLASTWIGFSPVVPVVAIVEDVAANLKFESIYGLENGPDIGI